MGDVNPVPVALSGPHLMNRVFIRQDSDSELWGEMMNVTSCNEGPRLELLKRERLYDVPNSPEINNILKMCSPSCPPLSTASHTHRVLRTVLAPMPSSFSPCLKHA